MHYFRGAEQQSIDVAKSPRFDISSFGKRLRCMNPQNLVGRLLGGPPRLDDDDRGKLLVLPTRNFAARLLCFSSHYLTFLEILSLKFE